MPHNPILMHNALARMEQPQIGRNQVGLLYAHGRYYRQLPTGATLTWSERLKGGLQLYTIDLKTHQMRWNARFRAEGQRDYFNISVDLDYQINNPQHMVENNVTDTESLILRTLEPQMRREAMQYKLLDYQEAEIAFEQLVTPTLFDTNGLQLLKVDVQVNLSEADLVRADDLRHLERAMRTPQLAEYQADLPSKSSGFKFEVNAIINFKVVNRSRLPTETLSEASEWLWKQVRAKLGRVSRRYTVDQLVDVDDALLEQLEANIYSAHGLEITSADIEVDLDEAGFTHAQTLAQLQRERIVEAERGRLTEIQQANELSAQERYITHYGPMIEKGEWQLLAVALAQNKQDINEVLGYLDERRKEKLNVQFALLNIAVQKEGLGEDIAEHVFTRTAKELVQTTSVFDEGQRLLNDAVGASQQAPQDSTTIPEDDETDDDDEIIIEMDDLSGADSDVSSDDNADVENDDDDEPEDLWATADET